MEATRRWSKPPFFLLARPHMDVPEFIICHASSLNHALGQPHECRFQVHLLLLENNFKLREIKEEDVNLETAFMRLTKGMIQ